MPKRLSGNRRGVQPTALGCVLAYEQRTAGHRKLAQTRRLRPFDRQTELSLDCDAYPSGHTNPGGGKSIAMEHPPEELPTRTLDKYRSTSSLMVALTLAMGLYFVALLAASAGMVKAFVGSEQFARELAFGPEHAMRVGAVSILYCISGVVYYVVGVLYILWYRRTNVNARALGAEHMECGPNAWAWIFVPVWGVWKSFESIQELWMSTATTDGELKVRPPFLAAWWGALFLAGLPRAWAMASLGPTPDAIESWALGTLLVLMLQAASGVLMLLTIRDIHSEQMLQARGLGLMGGVRSSSCDPTVRCAVPNSI